MVQNNNDNLTVSPIVEFYRNKSVFITGGTGFVGRAVIEKLLYQCEVKTIYMLIKAKKGKSIEQRLNEIIETEAFQRIKDEKADVLKRIIPISGDLVEINMGLSEKDVSILQREVSIVFHVAGNINLGSKSFLSPINVNTRGSQRIIQLCKGMKRLSVFVYVSSAFSQSNKQIIEEVVYPTKCRLETFNYIVDNLDGNYLYKNLIEGRPNVYTHSKALAEELISTELGDIPITVIRPSGICSSIKEPIPGWLYGWSGFNLIAMFTGKGLIRYWQGDPNNVIDIVPIDIVVNLTIASAWDADKNSKNTKAESKVKVFNCCSGLQNPVSLDQIFNSFATFGKVHFKRETLLPPKTTVIQSHLLYMIVSFLVHTLPAYLLAALEYIFTRRPRSLNTHRKILQLRSIFEYFAMNQFLLSDYNVKELYEQMANRDKELFNFDIKVVEWKQYLETFIIAVKKHLLREA